MSLNKSRTYSMAAVFIIALVAITYPMVSAQSSTETPQQATNVTPVTPPIKAPSACNLTKSKPSPPQQSYIFQNCIVAKFSAYLSLPNNQYIELKDGTTNQSTCGNVNGTNPTNPKLVISYDCAQLEFEFAQVNKTISVKATNGWYNVAGTQTPFTNSTTLFKTSDDGHYYKCNSEQPIFNEQKVDVNKTVALMLSNLAYEAFRAKTGTDFYRVPEECPLDSSEVSDLVRIGVGVSLVALVGLVLVAYFVGRRRWAERSSYESV